MTADPRYPVGPFESVDRALSGAEREALIATIEAHPSNMRAAVSGFGDTELDTPYRDGGSTVRQVVHHVVDSHVNSYIRFKLAVTEEHPRITTYDQDAWADLSDGRTAPVDGSLAILESLHPRWVAFLRSLPDEAFRRTIDHPDVGAMTVDALLEMYAWHCRHHEGHITRLSERMGW